MWLLAVKNNKEKGEEMRGTLNLMKKDQDPLGLRLSPIMISSFFFFLSYYFTLFWVMGILLMMFFGSTLGDELRRWFLENRKMMGIAVVVIDMSIKEMYIFFFFSLL